MVNKGSALDVLNKIKGIKDESKEQEPIPTSRDKRPEETLTLLANYKNNCSLCFGRGYEGKDTKTGEYVPCRKCVKNSWIWLDTRTGSISRH